MRARVSSNFLVEVEELEDWRIDLAIVDRQIAETAEELMEDWYC